jgi:hypothetical protein
MFCESPAALFPTSKSRFLPAVDVAYSASSPNIRRATLLSIGISLACLAGCARYNPRGDGFRESFSEAAHYERQVEPSAPSFGYSQKAREIERDFGVK